jgi:hypothetical protein
VLFDVDGEEFKIIKHFKTTAFWSRDANGSWAWVIAHRRWKMA